MYYFLWGTTDYCPKLNTPPMLAVYNDCFLPAIFAFKSTLADDEIQEVLDRRSGTVPTYRDVACFYFSLTGNFTGDG